MQRPFSILVLEHLIGPFELAEHAADVEGSGRQEIRAAGYPRRIRRDIYVPVPICVLLDLQIRVFAVLRPVIRAPMVEGAVFRARNDLRQFIARSGLGALGAAALSHVDRDLDLALLQPLGIEHQRLGAAPQTDICVGAVGRAGAVRLRVPMHQLRAVRRCHVRERRPDQDACAVFGEGFPVCHQHDLSAGIYRDRIEHRAVSLVDRLAGEILMATFRIADVALGIPVDQIAVADRILIRDCRGDDGLAVVTEEIPCAPTEVIVQLFLDGAVHIETDKTVISGVRPDRVDRAVSVDDLLISVALQDLRADILASALREDLSEIRDIAADLIPQALQHRLVVCRDAAVAVERDRGIGRHGLQARDGVVAPGQFVASPIAQAVVMSGQHLRLRRHCGRTRAAVQRDVRGQLDLLRRDGVLSAACRDGQAAVFFLIKITILREVQFTRAVKSWPICTAGDVVVAEQPDVQARRRNIDCATVVVCQRQSYTAV